MRARPSRAVLTLVAIAPLAAATACSTVLGIESNRHVEATGDDAGSAAMADWSCLGAVAPGPSASPVELSLFLNDVSGAQSSSTFDGTPVIGATMRACARLDLTCNSPLANAVSDDAGIARVTVPGGFDGYYEVNATDFTPTILARSPQLTGESAREGLANAALLALGAGVAGTTQDKNLSIVIVTAADCASNPAPGVSFTIAAPAPNETLVYLESGLPAAGTTETDATGSAVVFNVPAGTINVAATITADHRPIRTVAALVRTGWVTFVQMRLDASRHTPL